jgi:PKD repeat protein
MKKTIIVGIFLILFTVSIYPAIGKTNNFKENESTLFLETKISGNGLLPAQDIAYIQGTFELDCWLYSIDLDDPDDETCICPDYPGSGSGGTWTDDGVILTSELFTGILYEVNPITCEWKIIGGGGVDLNCLAYDPIGKETYACTDEALYKIDINTGEQEYIGKFSGSVVIMIGISFDGEGKLYGWDIGDNLWKINKNTASTDLVGSLGIDLDCAQDGAFHLADDILYLAAYTPDKESYLYECDEDSGNCTLIGQFSENTQVTLFAIPWNYDPDADFIWEPEYPEPGEEILFDASISTDPDDNIILYEWDWDNDGIYDESNNIPTTTHVYDDTGFYHITCQVIDEFSANDTKTKMIKIGNEPPETPVIDGPSRGKPFVYYDFSVTLEDSDGDLVFVRWDWGNGNTYPWDGPYTSGETITESYVWNKFGKYLVKAQVKDEYDAESEWGELEVKISFPRYKMQHNFLILEIFEQFPFIKHIMSLFGCYNYIR